MQQADIQDVLGKAGFQVFSFEYHPHFFGNWRATFGRDMQRFEIVSDNRDGWLTLWQVKPAGGADRKFEVESTRLSNTEQLVILAEWLYRV